MSIEDIALRWEGLDPAKIKSILDDTAALLSVVESEIGRVQSVLTEVDHLVGVVQGQLPRVNRLTADIRNQIAAYEAKQKEFNR